MGKKAKKIQTDYTTAGHEISQQAVPYYKQAMQNISDYANDPTQYIDKYLKYYDNTAQQSDFLRDYNRAMANATNRNYSATGGGYSSSGQRAYDDNQRYWNDEASRLSQANTSAAAQLAENYFNDNLAAQSSAGAGYRLGKDYSDIQQYNAAVDKNNSFMNQLGGSMGTIGGAIGSIWGPAGTMIGQAAGNALGSFMQTDTSGITGGTSSTLDNSGAFGSGGFSGFAGNLNKLLSGAKQNGSNAFRWRGNANMPSNAGSSVGGAVGNMAANLLRR